MNSEWDSSLQGLSPENVVRANLESERIISLSWELESVSRCHENTIQFTLAGAGPVAMFVLLEVNEVVGA